MYRTETRSAGFGTYGCAWPAEAAVHAGGEAAGGKGLFLTKGTIINSALKSASSSTFNRDRQGDPQARQVKKGARGTSGTGRTSGVDAGSGLAHSAEATAAHVLDASQASKLIMR